MRGSGRRSGSRGGGGRGERVVAEAKARRRHQQRRGDVALPTSHPADVALDHADRAVDSERDVAERGARQLALSAPLRSGGHVEPPAG